MRKTYQYRLYPNKEQTFKLLNQFEECRWLYNHLLNQRKDSWENNQTSIYAYDQQKYVIGLKKERQSLKTVHSQVLQDITIRIDLAFQAFFRRIKAKSTEAGYPRFKGKDRYDSITFKQSGFYLKDNKLKLSKVGNVKIELHRPIKGQIKTLTIRKNNLNQWFACFSVDIEECVALPKTNKIIGIDVGLSSFATYSDGTKIDNPRFLRNSEKELTALQSNYSKCKNKKNKRRLSKLHNKIANQRKDFCHKLSRNIINEYDTICIEDLAINKMVKSHQMAKSIYDAAWFQFAQFLIYKAEEADRKVVQVNPAYTSQDCSGCGYRVAKQLSDRIHNCPNCGLSMDRDVNASLNILRLGTSFS
jgi:putative transposase